MAVTQQVDNSIYNAYGERWYTAFDDPIALLRAENAVKIPWILNQLRFYTAPGHSVLDVGCGGGFLTNDLAKRGFTVTGVDISAESLRIARAHDVTHSVKYEVADAYALPYADESFDVVTSMDFLEHIRDPMSVVKECARVLKPKGLFFFHTFNRNEVSHLLVIKMVEKFIKNTPKNMHVLDLFIRPDELKEYCQKSGMQVLHMAGLRPELSRGIVKTLFSGVVSPSLRFKLTPSTLISYLGVAIKTEETTS